MDDPNSQPTAPSWTAPDGARVLIIESDDVIGRILKSKLSKWGYKVVLDNSGHGALQWFRNDTYRIVLVGHDLPDMTGADLIHRLRGISRPTYTYIFSIGRTDDREGAIKALEAGADETVLKPINGTEFAYQLRNAERILSLTDRLFAGGGTEAATGVLNRAAFTQFLSVSDAHYRRAKIGGGVLLFIDIANHHDVFLSFGFETALELERKAAENILPILRNSDLFAHLDGGAFCLLLHDTTADKCGIVINRLKPAADALAIETTHGEIRGRVSYSQVSFPWDGAQGPLSATSLLTEATRLPVA